MGPALSTLLPPVLAGVSREFVLGPFATWVIVSTVPRPSASHSVMVWVHEDGHEGAINKRESAPGLWP